MPETLTDQSRDRLLLAAVEVFADKGFHQATVREICKRGAANVAAVNYYFRSKEKLYAEALVFAFQQAEQLYPFTQAMNKALPSEQRLTNFISTFLHRILDDSALSHHGKLIAHEISQPSQALDEIVISVIKPVFALLEDIVNQITGASLPEHRIKRCVLSILGQCLMFKHSRSVIDRVCPELIASPEEIDNCAEHIFRFSLLALEKVNKSGAEQGT